MDRYLWKNCDHSRVESNISHEVFSHCAIISIRHIILKSCAHFLLHMCVHNTRSLICSFHARAREAIVTIAFCHSHDLNLTDSLESSGNLVRDESHILSPLFKQYGAQSFSVHRKFCWIQVPSPSLHVCLCADLSVCLLRPRVLLAPRSFCLLWLMTCWAYNCSEEFFTYDYCTCPNWKFIAWIIPISTVGWRDIITNFLMNVNTALFMVQLYLDLNFNIQSTDYRHSTISKPLSLFCGYQPTPERGLHRQKWFPSFALATWLFLVVREIAHTHIHTHKPKHMHTNEPPDFIHLSGFSH